MILGIDIGGTKTQIATFSTEGRLEYTKRFATSSTYSDFIQELTSHMQDIDTRGVALCVTAVPGRLDRKSGVVEVLGNLPWRNEPIAQDIATASGVKNVIIENDSKLAGLAEARSLDARYKRVLYLTLSTGIGGALVTEGSLSSDISDMEIGKIPLEYKGSTSSWENIASGRVFAEEFNQPASEVTDVMVWKNYADRVAKGLTIAFGILQVDAVVFGGGLGQYADRFTEYLAPHINKLHPIIVRPKLLTTAHFKDESVIYGCYQYAQDYFKRAT